MRVPTPTVWQWEWSALLRVTCWLEGSAWLGAHSTPPFWRVDGTSVGLCLQPAPPDGFAPPVPPPQARPGPIKAAVAL